MSLTFSLNELDFFKLIACSSLVAAILISFLRSYRRKQLAGNLQCCPDGPSYKHIDPVFGLDFILENVRAIIAFKFARRLRERFTVYGTTYQARMGFSNVINTIDPRNLETIMATDFDSYTVIPHRTKLVSTLFSNGIFTTSGNEWRHSRSMVRSSLSNLDSRLDAMEEHCANMLQSLAAASSHSANREVDFGLLAKHYIFGVVAELFLGKDATQTDSNAIQQLADDFATLGRIGRAITPFISFIKYLPRLLFWKHLEPAQRRLFQFVDTCITKAVQHQSTPQDQKPSTVIEALASQTPDLTRIRGETLNLFLAGHDTVHIALTELFWHLARNPRAYARLREEIAFLDGRPPSTTTSDLKNLTYLGWVVNETLRLNPTLAVHGRLAIRDTVLPSGGGKKGDQPLLVEKGTYIAYGNYALHRNPDVFGADVDSFIPERWENIKPARFEYLPFGAGPRRCPGRDLGWTMVAYAVVRIVQVVKRVTPAREGEVWEEARGFSFYNRHGVKVVVEMDEEFNMGEEG